MIEPKIKAKELVDKFMEDIDFSIPKYAAKECAIIACQQVIKYLEEFNQIKYWYDVLTEVEKL